MQKARKPIEIKISTVVAISAILHETDPAALEKALKDMTGGVSDFFEDEFAVLDIGALEGATAADIDWQALVGLFKAFRLNTVAVRNAPQDLHAGIVAHGLAIDTPAAAGAGAANARAQETAEHKAPPAKPAPQPEPAAAPVPAPSAAAAPAARTMIVDTPVRAGQRIYARGADLVVMAAVNNGAEIIADGSIHVYAPLRGRALAGASGNTEARIFAASLEAELVSIAGVYRTFENGPPAEVAGKQVQVRLNGERIDVLAMQAA
ncbi:MULTISPECIES: septum site-determining protein MinC [unclassified Herbaspirillum]|uniref:septum site-determining protein MinC n=1 Tax=unclassified Herbaspirillum TaxID=2624150 RepID=UPI0011531B28|nr:MULTISPECIES: septum site-determining protein MinC [unclassified Herbaspirillum]MBB5390254.1 septum site-determining protein MinC [Herbaspirillum sp. SJZ102]TQK09248.1 septum site-determining protein MinC [Herbaspirillum sp. SJZ130]TQK14065.1 septum site-determining protein MinC [Herbaspirillum sp. SJZ106]TWC69764.1 septum site-determining protein MinC [Herbaspirillum sp. SJZ099]